MTRRVRPQKLTKIALQRRWAEIMQAYRRRQRRWVMAYMPSMSQHEWKQYETWVSGFGAEVTGMTGRHSRKVRRQLRAAKGNAFAAPRISLMGTTSPVLIGNAIHKRMEFAKAMNRPIIPRARERPNVTPEKTASRATRRSYGAGRNSP